MLSLIVAFIGAALAGALSSIWLDSTFWILFFAMIGFFITTFIINRIFGKQLQALVAQVQMIIQAKNEEAMRMLNRFRAKPLGSEKLMQNKIEKKMAEGFREALVILEQAQPLYKWNLLAERSVNTYKFQFYYQLKEYDKADEVRNKIFATEPLILAMKMARQYANEDPKLDKTYQKGAKKFKYEKGVIIHALYSWILLKQKRYDKALEVLDEAKEKTESEVLARNWQHVANNKYNSFSNAGLGDEWYSLQLEKPPKQKPGKGQYKDNPFVPKGKRRYF